MALIALSPGVCLCTCFFKASAKETPSVCEWLEGDPKDISLPCRSKDGQNENTCQKLQTIKLPSVFVITNFLSLEILTFFILLLICFISVIFQP